MKTKYKLLLHLSRCSVLFYSWQNTPKKSMIKHIFDSTKKLWRVLQELLALAAPMLPSATRDRCDKAGRAACPRSQLTVREWTMHRNVLKNQQTLCQYFVLVMKNINISWAGDERDLKLPHQLCLEAFAYSTYETRQKNVKMRQHRLRRPKVEQLIFLWPRKLCWLKLMPPFREDHNHTSIQIWEGDGDLQSCRAEGAALTVIGECAVDWLWIPFWCWTTQTES